MPSASSGESRGCCPSDRAAPPKPPQAAPQRPRRAARGTVEAAGGGWGRASRGPYPAEDSQARRITDPFSVKGIPASVEAHSLFPCRPAHTRGRSVRAAARRQGEEPRAGGEVLIRSQALPVPIHVGNSGGGSMANAMKSSSFVSLANNVMGYNWGNYGLLEEAKHRCLSPGSGYARPQQLALNSPFSRSILPDLKFPQNLPVFRRRWGRRGWGMEGGERHAGRETHKERRRKKRRRRVSERVWVTWAHPLPQDRAETCSGRWAGGERGKGRDQTSKGLRVRETKVIPAEINVEFTQGEPGQPCTTGPAQSSDFPRHYSQFLFRAYRRRVPSGLKTQIQTHQPEHTLREGKKGSQLHREITRGGVGGFPGLP